MRRFVACPERTENISPMSVTPDVFQLETSELKFPKFWKSAFMLVINETSQSAMGPYSAIADATSASNAWTAFFREAVLVKVPGSPGCDDEGGEGREGDEGGGEGDVGGGDGDSSGGVGGGSGSGGGVGVDDPVARSTGSHCGRQATPLAEGRACELRWPTACPCADSGMRTAQRAATPMRTRLLRLRCFAWCWLG